MYDIANPDYVGYPHEQDDWWKYVDADEKYIQEEQLKMQKALEEEYEAIINGDTAPF